MTRILILYHSLYGHLNSMAKAAAEGVNSVNGVTAVLKRVPETLPKEVIEKMGATGAQEMMDKEVEVISGAEELTEYDGIILGIPTRFGNICSQMGSFFETTGGLWQSQGLNGKVGAVMTSTGSQHGGSEATQFCGIRFLLHQGLHIVGLPYSFEGQTNIKEIVGGSPYGASTIAGSDGSRMPSEIDLAGATYQGKRVATLAQQISGGNKKDEKK